MELSTAQVAAGGLRWSITEAAGDGPPILMLHGFTGSGAFWRTIAAGLSPRRCILPDLPGHGATGPPVPAESWGLGRAASALTDVLGCMGVTEYHAVGYSMGGRIAMHLALQDGIPMRSLTLVGASPGLEAAEARAGRIASDEALARMLETQGIEAFVHHWEALPLFATQQAIPASARDAMRATRMSQNPSALAAALRAFGVGTQRPLVEDLGSLRIPVLLVAGERDWKYREIVERMRDRIPDARVGIVPEAGHAVPLERPREFTLLLASFLQTLAAKEGSNS